MNFAGPFDSELTHVSPVSLGGDGFTFNKPTFISHHPSDSHVVIPDAHLLFSGEYTRIGSDLIISGDGQKIVVGNYFKGEARPALTSKDGATLAGHIVDALTGHVHYAQANATAPAAGQVIGNVLKMSGSATAIRNGVSIELHIGDAIQKGDVIQTGSDSSIGMTFVDGSAFGMTSNARMVLNEMIYDPNGSSNSSLMSLVQGTITFVAGQTAKNGNMRVETPVATMGIRGTAVLVEIGANDGPTKFSVLVEPDGHTGSYNLYDKATGQLIGTVSQAGQVTYVTSLGLGQPPSAIEQLKTLQDQQNEKSIIQQVFQLYFPNYKPDDSNPKSQKFGFNTSGNNLAEIVFTTHSDQQKTFLTQIELRFAVTDPLTGAVTYQNRIFYNAKASFSADSVFGNQAFVPTTESFKFADVVKIDDPDIGNAPFYDIGVPFVPGSALIKSAISTIPQMSEAFLKSLLSINQTTGVVSFDRQQFNFLDDGQTVTFKIQVTATSGPDTGLVEIPVTIAGANDAPTIVIGDALHPSVITGAVTEDTPSGASNLVADGLITFQDFDLTDAHTATVALTSTASTLPGFVSGAGSSAATTRLGTFTIDPVSEDLTNTDNHGSVGWHFTLADNDPTLQSLAKGQTITQTYTITIKDNNGVPVTQTVTITITGTNDAPELTADTAIHNTVEIADTTGAPNTTVDTATGTLTFVDVDLSNTHQAGAALHLNADTTPSVSWSGGAYSGIPQATRDALADAMTATVSENNTDTDNQGSVSWKFTLPDHLLDFLAEGQTLTVIYDVTVTDNDGASSTTQVVVRIGAANDQPVISVIYSSGTVTEDATSAPGILHDTGSVSFTDTDLTDTHTMSAAFNGAVGGNGASVSPALLTALATALSVPGSTLAAGVHTFDWDFALSNGLVQYLGAGETVTATYTITVKDGSGDNMTDTSAGQTVTVVITGTNDTPTITAVDVNGAVKEDTIVPVNTLHDSGSVTFADVDATDHETATVAFVSDATSSSAAIPGALHSALQNALTLQTSSFTTNNGTINWHFNLDNSLVQYLADGETVTVTYTITVKDDSGTATDTSAPQTVTVVITGTNDTPVIGAATLTGAVTEDATPPAQTGSETATGTIAFSDVDLTDTHTVGVAFKSTDYSSQLGSLTAVKTSDTSGGIDGLITWTFTVSDAATNQLAAGQTVHEIYTVTLNDGEGGIVTRDVVVTIIGANDDAVITVAAGDSNIGAATEDAHAVTETATGTLSFSDVDLTDAHTITAAPVGTALGTLIAVKTADTTNGTGGSLSWTYSVADSAIQHLAAGQQVDEKFTISIFDGTSTVTKEVTVTVAGANDDAIITVSAGDSDIGAVTEDEHSVTETATGTLSFSDVDLTDTHTITAAPVGTTLGTLTATKTTDTANGTGGSLEWTYSVANSAIHYLADGETKTETFKVSIFDGTSTVTKDVVVTIHGTNDVPVIAGVAAGDVIEDMSVDNGYLKTDGTLTITDSDHDQSTFVAQTSAAGSYGTFTLDANGHWTYTADNSQAAIQQLGANDTLTDSFTAHSLDGSADQLVTVTIHGTNDVPVFVAGNGVISPEYVLTPAEGPQYGVALLSFGYDRVLADINDASGVPDFLDVADSSGTGQRIVQLGPDGQIADTDRIINEIQTGEQRVVATASSDSGLKLVVWATIDGSGGGARIVGADGEAVGHEISLAGLSSYAYATALSDGGFAITTSANNFLDISVTKVDATGQIVGSPYVVSSGTYNEFVIKGIAPTDGGGFILFKESNGLVAQAFDANAIPAGAAYQVSSLSTDIAVFSDLNVVRLPDHEIFVSWSQFNPASGSKDVFARVLNADGSFHGSEFLVSTSTSGEQTSPLATVLSNGTIAVSWYDNHNLWVRYVDEDGNFLSNPVQINSTPLALISLYSGQGAVATPDGGVLFAWRGVDSDGEGVRGQHLNALGQLDGPEILFNTSSAGNQMFSGIAGTESGLMFVSWFDQPTGNIVVRSIDFSTHTVNEQVGLTGSSAVDSVTGTIKFADIDLSDHPTVDAVFTSATFEDAHHNSLPISSLTPAQQASIAALEHSLALTPAGSNTNNGSVGWDYTAVDGALDFLGAGEKLALTYTVSLTDQSGSTVNQLLTIDIVGTNDAPVINIDNVTPVELNGGGVTKVLGVTLSDVDAGADTFTVTATADHGTVSTADTVPVALGGSGVSGNFAVIGNIFANGAVYTPDNTSPTDKVTLTVTDSHGGSDSVNFIFKQFDPSGGVTLNGTSGKDWILSSTGNDTMTGGAGHDNFVFAPSSGQDTITDFTHGDDKIDFHMLTGGPTSATITTWLASSAVETVGSDTMLHLNGTTDTVLLKGVTSLSVSDFILHA